MTYAFKQTHWEDARLAVPAVSSPDESALIGQFVQADASPRRALSTQQDWLLAAYT